MLRTNRGLLMLALVFVAAACGQAAASAGSDPAAGSAGIRSDRITLKEIRERGQYSSIYDVVEHFHPRWLRSQGPDTFMGPQGQVQVHMDGNWMGSVDVLRRLSPTGVTSIEFLSPIDAAARFGLDHSHGAIVISTGVAAASPKP